MLSTVKNSAIAGITALALAATTAAPAQAWGEREQNFLAGVATTIIVGSIIRDARQPRRVIVPAPQPLLAPVVYAPTYVNIYVTPCAYGFNSYNSSQRRAIQAQLASAGYYHGAIDGAFGPATYNAVVSYAAATGQSSALTSTTAVYGIYDNLVY